jgi:trigger factor
VKVTLERLPESRVQLDVEVESDRLTKSLDAAYRRLAPKAKVPGFRPGKAPRALTEKYIGSDRLMNEAIDKLLPEVYNEAIEEQDVDAIAQPELDQMNLDPLRFKFIVPVRPSVDISSYKAIRIEPEAAEVTPEMLEEQITLIRRRYATQVPVDRGVAWDDFLIADVAGEVDGDRFVEDVDAEFPLREGQGLFVDGLAEGFLGMKKGEEKTFEIAIPEDFRVERLQGKTATFTLAIKEVKEEQLPDLDDDLAQQVNAEEFPTFDALRERIRADLEKAITEQAENAYRAKAVDALVEAAAIEFPRVLAEREIDHIIRDSMGNDSSKYAAYLRRVGRSESEYRESLREAAESRVRRSLALSELAEAEGIDVSAEEIEGELDKLVESLGEDTERFRQMFGTEEGVSTIRRNLLTRKTLERLATIARGEVQEGTA